MSRFAVVGCSGCSEYWVIEDVVGVHGVDQHECPRCETRHSDSRLRRWASAETWEAAVEKRSALLADKRNAGDEFADIDHYAELEDEWNQGLVDEPLGVQVVTGEFSNDHHLEEDELESLEGDESDLGRLGDLRRDGDAGLWLVQQYPAESSGTVRIDEDSRPGELWQRLVNILQEDIALAVRELAGGTGDGVAWQAIEAIVDDQLGMVDRDALEDAEDLHGSIVTSTLLSLCKDVDSEQHQQALELLRSFGETDFGPLGIGFNGEIEDIRRIVKPLLAASVHTPTLTVRIDESFREIDHADQRRRMVQLLSWLGHGVDVQVVFESSIWMRRFAWTYDPQIDVDELDGNVPDVEAFNVSSQCSTGQRAPGAVDDHVAAALKAIDTDGEVVATLERIGGEAGQTASYDALYAAAPYDDPDKSSQNVRNHLRQLRKHELVTDRIGTSDGSKVAIRPAGVRFLDEIGRSGPRQKALQNFVSRAGKSTDNLESRPAHTREGGTGWSRDRLPALHTIQPLPRSTYQAALTATPENGVATVDATVSEWEDRAAPHRYMDWEQDRLAVAAEVDNAMQWAVCTARSLGDSFVWDNLLTEERFDEHGDFRRLLQEAPDILRNSACLGWLVEDDELVDDIEEFGDRMEGVLTEICEMTRDMTHGEYREYDSRKAFRTEILTESLGVIGVMTRLLDFAGIDILRIGRMPRFKNDFDDEKLSAIAKFVGINSAIASTYGMASVFRQLFEDRDEVLRWSMDVDVDAAEPFGELIGSWCLFTDYGDRQEVFAEELRTHVSPKEVREDAPEIGVRVPVQTSASREQYRDLLERCLDEKNLLVTPEAVSVLHGLCRSPLAVANGVAEALEPEDEPRHIRSVELRRVIAALSPAQVLRDASSTPRKALVALAGADEFMNQSELAERAGVSARSLRDHLPDLVDAGIVATTDTGYRLQLSFEETDRDDGELPERYQDIYPQWVSDPTVSNDVHAAAGALRTGRKHHGPDGPVEEEDIGFAGDVLLDLEEPWPLIDDVLPALWAVTTRDSYRRDADVAGAALAEPDVEVMGKRPRQLSLQEATNEGVRAT
ncbi:DUF5817 domain-containing protein [Haloarcula sp. AONF1]